MHRIFGARGRRRRRGLLLSVVLAVAGLGAFMITNALAVHDLTFQLDGDVIASTTTNVGGTTQTLDWDSVFTSAGANKNPLPTGFTAAKFTRDFNTTASGGFNTSDDTTFATGSKDTLDITPGWQCNHDANVNSKIDIMNAYAGAFTSAGGHQIVYFALERNSNAGDGNVGFWFLQDSVGCTSPSGSTAFSGHHRDGDLLIVSAFTNGGSVSNVSVYRWNDPDGPGGAPGSLGTTPVALGGDCKTQSPGATDSACATVNAPSNGTNGTITTPWLTSNKVDGVGHSLRTSEFFEGGLDLSETNLAGHCFNVFIGDTRSSQSLTATLFDYAQGQIGECRSTTVTTPVQSDGTTQMPASSEIPAAATVTVKDSAVLTVNGVSSFTGTMDFHLCGPLAANSTSTCDTGGVEIGSKPATASGTIVSDGATITSVGRYCWRADFSGDTSIGVPASSDHSSTECFAITPKTPTLATTAGAGPVNFGDAVTDTATLTGTANEPGTGGPSGSNGSINPATAGGSAQGSITFTLYQADCTTVATGTGTNPQSASVNGDGTYGPVSFTPDAPGTYHWVASYTGDSPNTNSTDHNTACDDTNEDVVVRQIPTAITTSPSAYPQDSATITSTVTGDNLPSNGTVVFRLYGPAGGNTALQNCTNHGNTVGSGGLLYRETQNPVGGTHSKTVNTNNTTVSVSDSASTTYYWRVTYDTGDTAHTGRQSDCVENQQSQFTGDAGPGTVFP
jgi:hypothetical protein